MLSDKETMEKMLEAILMCMDYPMSQMDSDEEYDQAVDLQNDLKEKLAELKGE